jgi:hypothetical protein
MRMGLGVLRVLSPSGRALRARRRSVSMRRHGNGGGSCAAASSGILALWGGSGDAPERGDEYRAMETPKSRLGRALFGSRPASLFPSCTPNYGAASVVRCVLRSLKLRSASDQALFLLLRIGVWKSLFQPATKARNSTHENEPSNVPNRRGLARIFAYHAPNVPPSTRNFSSFSTGYGGCWRSRSAPSAVQDGKSRSYWACGVGDVPNRSWGSVGESSGRSKPARAGQLVGANPGRSRDSSWIASGVPQRWDARAGEGRCR